MKCSVNNGGCEHKCSEYYVEKRKNLACTCRRGYKLQPDGKKCAGEMASCNETLEPCILSLMRLEFNYSLGKYFEGIRF